MAKVTNWDELPIMLGTRHVQGILDVGEAKARKLIKEGFFPSIKVGRTYKIPRDNLRETLERMSLEKF